MEISSIFQTEPFLVPTQLVLFDASSKNFHLVDILSDDFNKYIDYIPLGGYFEGFESNNEQKIEARYTKVRCEILQQFVKM